MILIEFLIKNNNLIKFKEKVRRNRIVKRITAINRKIKKIKIGIKNDIMRLAAIKHKIKLKAAQRFNIIIL